MGRRWLFGAACVAGAVVAATARETPGVKLLNANYANDDAGGIATVARRKLLQSETPILDWLISRQPGQTTSTPILDWLTRVSSSSDESRATPVLDWFNARSSVDAPTPFLDWMLARQSNGDTGTPALDMILDFFIDTSDTLFGSTLTWSQRVTNRVSTFFFSELLRFDLTPTEERQAANENRQALESTTWNSTFSRDLFNFVEGATDAQTFGFEHLNMTKFIENDVCGSDFLRGDLNSTILDDAYWQASSFSSANIPRGCYTGCIIGSGSYEALARAYGVRRTFNLNSWKGKCFDEIDPSSVTNLIQLNYGNLMERIFPRLETPIELYPGRAEVADSTFQEGQDSIVVDYSTFDHDFTYFRDELRPIYTNVYLGKMYAMPGMSMFGGVFSVPLGARPVFTVNFILVGNGQTTPPLVIVD